jgi:hypothetical protein
LVFGFFFMITALTYCLRGWLAALMVNKRRRRAIIMAITMAFVLLSQLPNLMMNVWRHDRFTPPPATATEAQNWIKRETQRRAAERADTLRALDMANCYVPLLWLPQGARALAEGRVWPALWGAFGMLAIGTLGLTRAYHSTVRFYQGGETKKAAPAPPATRPIGVDKKILLEWTLPAVPDDAAAMAMATFRSMSRAPEVKMALAMSVLIFVVLGASVVMRSAQGLPPEGKPFVASAAVAVAFFVLMQVMFNHFGFDRGGFRAMVLLPTLRRRILLGKNLALLPVALAVFAVYLVLATILAHLRASDVVTAGFEFAGAFLAMSAMGNLASILAPYRIAPGSMKPTKTTGMTTFLIIIVANLLFPMAMLPVFLPAGLGALADSLGWLPGAAVTLACAFLFAALSALVYWRTLEPLGQLLQRREQRILQVVTQEVE